MEVVELVWRKVKGSGKLRYLKIPLPPHRRGRRKYVYRLVPLPTPSVRDLIDSVYNQTGLDGVRALVYFYLTQVGWDDVSARQIASISPVADLDRYY